MRTGLLALLSVLMIPACAAQDHGPDLRGQTRSAGLTPSRSAGLTPSRGAGLTPFGADISLPREVRLVSARVAAGATLASLLRANQVAEREIGEVVARTASVFDVRKLRTAQPYRLEQSVDGAVHRFEYEIDGDRYLRVTQDTVEILLIEKTRAVEVVRGAVDRRTPSLFAAIEAAGETVDLTLSLAEIFSGEVDFNVDVQPGDRFELVVEKQYREQHAFAGYGPILAAEFDNAGRRLRAVRFTPQNGAPTYFDERGVSLRRFLLRSPLKFQPIVTSGFSRARLHPILREVRPHLGVDYKAPVGAPVVASADGLVLEAGMNGGAGRMVHLRHPNGFESEYLHLSSITVRAGARVRQGDVIGRVGASGLATGPHLDYRVKRNGAFVNPLTVHRLLPPADPVPAAELAAFAVARDRALASLSAPAVAHASAPVAEPRQ